MRLNASLVGGKSTIGLRVILLSLFLVVPNFVSAGGCQTGAEAIANASVRMSPIIAYYFGSIEDYVRENRSHFVAGGDAIVCAQRMSQALARGAFQNFDPQARQRRDELNAELGAMGVSPGQQYASPSQQMYAMARQMDKLAYALPYAAEGNFTPLWTPRDQIEQMQIFAMRMFGTLMQNPETSSALAFVRPQIEELANIEYRMILSIARGL